MPSLEHIRQVRQSASQLFNMVEVESGIDRVARQINGALADANPVVLTAMNGGLIFAGLLLPKLGFPLQQDYAHTSRYGDETEGGELRWIAEPRLDLRNRTVLIVDDILDQGVTLKAIDQYCRDAGADKVLSVVLVQKLLDESDCCFAADYVALTAPNEFLIGCGLDYKGYWRNAPGIFTLDKSALNTKALAEGSV